MVDLPSDPYYVGPGGFLLDRNGDGHPDDLAVRIVLPPDPAAVATDLWCALVDLAARLGLESCGLPDRLVLTAAEPVPPDCLPLHIRPAGTATEPAAAGMSLADAAAVRSLARGGIPPVLPAADEQTDPLAIADLGRLFTPAGLLRDRDGDHLPDGTRLALLLPAPCPPPIAVAAIEFAARIGLESGGIDLPLAFRVGTELPAGAIALDLTPNERESKGESARLRVVADGRLRIDGDAAGIANLLRFLAWTWPALAAETASNADVEQVADAIRAQVTGAVDTTAPDSDEVFALDWHDQWEVDRVLAVVQDELIPLLAGNGEGALDVLVLVSEPPEIRQSLEREIAARIAPAATGDAEVRVRVRSAYKAGLSWLREDVIPSLRRVGGVNRVELRYAPAPATEEGAPPRLDLPIRWLQELYPGDELLASALGLPLDAIDLVERTPEDGAVYETVAFRNGSEVWRESFSPRWYELPYVPLDPARGRVLVSTGGVRAVRGGSILVDRAVPTDCDRFWVWYQETVLPRVGDYLREVSGGSPLPADQPCFAALRVDAWVSEPNESLALREEIDSAAEALHEDVYFGSLDWLAAFGKTLGGDELSGPGAILPFIHVVPGRGPHARVTLTARPRGRAASVPIVSVVGIAVGPGGLSEIEVSLDAPPGADPGAMVALLRNAAAQAPAAAQHRAVIPVTIHTEAAGSLSIDLPLPADPLAGVALVAAPPAYRILFADDLPPLLARLRTRAGVTTRKVTRSYQDRPLWVIEIFAPMSTRRWSPAKLSLRKPTLFVIGRHHANEVASTTAAFLLAERLTTDPNWQLMRGAVNVVILPFANPDGAALHQGLVAEHPTWKHHAARYNAAGLEFAPHVFDERTPFGEARARGAVWRRWLPDVAVDNHGVPSHEWTQHFAGFGSPPRFGVSYWIVQALLYGIITHVDAPAQAAFAQELRLRLASALKATPELDVPNRILGHRYQRWGASRVPARFPADVEDGFLCYVRSNAPDPASRNFGIRFPRTTTLDWVTEVPDETAHGERLALTANAHLLANEVALRLMSESAPRVERIAEQYLPDSLTIRLRRRRPLPVRETSRAETMPPETSYRR